MNGHADRPHALYGASSAHRWFPCPGSIALINSLPELPAASPEALDGTAAHELLEAHLRLAFENGKLDGTQRAHFTKIIEDAPLEREDAVQVCVGFVHETTEKYPDAQLFVETPFELPCPAAPGQVYGTCDILIYVPSLKLLIVVDYKHGAGIYVDAKGNKQLRFYGAGGLSAHPEWDVSRIWLVIVQPRCPFGEPVRGEEVDLLDLVEFHWEVNERVIACQQDNAPLVPGQEQCKFCPAAVGCPAREKQAVSLVGAHFGSVRQITEENLPKVNVMSPDYIAHVLHFGDLVEDWLKDVRRRGFEFAQAGVNIPGFKVVEAQARRSFNLPENPDNGQIGGCAELLSEVTDKRVSWRQFVKTTLVGITEAEKLIKTDAKAQAPKGKSKQAVEDAMQKFAFLTTKKSSGNLSLVAEDDPRPAVSRTATDFQAVVAIPHIKNGE